MRGGLLLPAFYFVIGSAFRHGESIDKAGARRLFLCKLREYAAQRHQRLGIDLCRGDQRRGGAERRFADNRQRRQLVRGMASQQRPAKAINRRNIRSGAIR